MPPDVSWNDFFSKCQFKLSPEEEWKKFMKDCLMETEILKKFDSHVHRGKCVSLDPNTATIARQEMVKNREISKLLPIPKENIQTVAWKLIRDENRKKLTKQKEEKIIKKEIEKLKQFLENYRLINAKELEHENPKLPNNRPKFAQPHIKLGNRFEAYEGFCEIDGRISPTVQVTMETNITRSGTPFGVKVYVKRKQITQSFSEPVPCNWKGSLSNYEGEVNVENNGKCWDYSESNGKNEIMQRFFQTTREVIPAEKEQNANFSKFKRSLQISGKTNGTLPEARIQNAQVKSQRLYDIDENGMMYKKPSQTMKASESQISFYCNYEEVLPKPKAFDCKSKEQVTSAEDLDNGRSAEECEPEIDSRKLWEHKTALLCEYINKWRLEKAWTTWRKFVLKRAQVKSEKMNYKHKIENFLTKLQQNEVNLKKNKGKSETKLEIKHKQGTKLKGAVVLSRQDENGVKEKQLKQISQEVKISQREAYQQLMKFDTEKAVALKNQVKEFKIVEDVKRVFPVPEFLQKMEKRREERNNRWKEIRERKKQLEEERRIRQREKEKEKKLLEEFERSKMLEDLKKKRRLEKENMEKQRIEKQKFKAQLQLAGNYYDRILFLRYGLKPWLRLMELKNMQEERAKDYYEKALLKRIFTNWRMCIGRQIDAKQKKAEELYRKILHKNYFVHWLDFCNERVKQLQVAVDWDDLKIVDKFFKNWFTFTQMEKLEYLDKKELAICSYNKKLKTKYLQAWQNYPELKKLEAAKENRKRMWRQKVQEILPDYRPMQLVDN